MCFFLNFKNCMWQQSNKGSGFSGVRKPRVEHVLSTNCTSEFQLTVALYWIYCAVNIMCSAIQSMHGQAAFKWWSFPLPYTHRIIGMDYHAWLQLAFYTDHWWEISTEVLFSVLFLGRWGKAYNFVSFVLIRLYFSFIFLFDSKEKIQTTSLFKI